MNIDWKKLVFTGLRATFVYGFLLVRAGQA